jgi:hypothetical protein
MLDDDPSEHAEVAPPDGLASALRYRHVLSLCSDGSARRANEVGEGVGKRCHGAADAVSSAAAAARQLAPRRDAAKMWAAAAGVTAP